MCFGGGNKSAENIANQQRADEDARQARIARGMSAINGMFDGGQYGKTTATSYDPNQVYYNADGTTWSHESLPQITAALSSGGSGFQGGGRGRGGNKNPNTTTRPNANTAYYQQEQARQNAINEMISSGRLFTDVGTAEGFGEDFYTARSKAYEDYALPQLDTSYGKAKDSLVYALDRSGLLQSSAALKKNSDLSSEFDKNRIDIANQGLNIANETRANVEGVRSNLVSQLNATGDDSAAAQAALRNASTLQMPQGFSPLGEMFSSFASGLSSIGSNSRNDYSGLVSQAKSLFNPSGGSSRVVN